jgi:hypothetical protein
MPVGEQLRSISAIAPDPELTSTFFFCRVISRTASATFEPMRSNTASTPLVSNHSRTIVEAMSAFS